MKTLNLTENETKIIRSVLADYIFSIKHSEHIYGYKSEEDTTEVEKLYKLFI